jgi:1-acyl-sn-glycerol-3-phosphate acyltransferase
VPGLLARFNYGLSRFLGRSIFFITMNVRAVRPEAADRAGGYVLACTHFSHLEPICLSVILRRKIDWMARLEFFRYRLIAAILWAVDAFSVNRFGIPVRSIRTAVARCAAGRVVGIFPEGGVVTGKASMCRGGAMKRGACVVARRANVPIIPCVILGVHTLNRVPPWIPYRRGNLWAIFGDPVWPVQPGPGMARRQAREVFARRVEASFVSLYNELLEKYGLDDRENP